MLKANAKVGMIVVFGRTGYSAEKSLGEIVKCNPSMAKVKLLEERGSFKVHPVGTVFRVPYEMIEQPSVERLAERRVARTADAEVRAVEVAQQKLMAIKMVVNSETPNPLTTLDAIQSILSK